MISIAHPHLRVSRERVYLRGCGALPENSGRASHCSALTPGSLSSKNCIVTPVSSCKGIIGIMGYSIKSTSTGAPRSCVNDIMITSSESAGNAANSGHHMREAPFGRLRGARWPRHSSLCGACHTASSFLAGAPLSASEFRGRNQSIHMVWPDGIPQDMEEL